MRTLQYLLLLILIFFFNFEQSYSDDVSKDPRIVIIGAGAAGIAAASKLLENGFKNVTILEAEGRIGGRVFTVTFGDYNIDLGGQWVHGEGENVVLKLAYPLGLLDKTDDPLNKAFKMKYLDSKGNLLQESLAKNIKEYFFDDLFEIRDVEAAQYKSAGEYAEKSFEERFKDVSEMMQDKKKFLHLLEMLVIGSEAAPTWHDISTVDTAPYRDYEGDFLTNWKTRGYSTILDILMKRYPDPEKELPVMNQTFLNTEVTSIDYSNNTKDLPILITSANGQSFKADHVIVAVSLGVLKEKYKSLFVPPLPEKKIETIEGLGYGIGGKIFLLFDKPFWDLGNERMLNFNFMWNADDRKSIESDPEKEWTLGLAAAMTVNHKPNLLEYWISGNYTKMMEQLPEDKVFNHTVEHLQRFLGKQYNVTTPIDMMRSSWYSSPHFRGIYSYTSVEAGKKKLGRDILEEPVNAENLLLLFAGEATNSGRSATVDGAIESGWKAADRLIEHYGKNVKKDS